ncbi:desulfurase [Methylovirgula ligni]|uniref:ABC-type nitrate/sulfonate/bicarbonate transport system substrate-binding protein n=1 Tax=Methylovirgula ligni TaxID=569860 RepID=A0A3D9YPW7_9HYPH|nr:ABC transporter substrate-binding protein [Methylovirgula ligni]QAY96626.1 desulfurase [Methylovirgula ligni]REF84058.1 ABC-type nitrate/sulfonate/bicarbonate transport system substrate-binding protein [Methylovirgula ligni]
MTTADVATFPKIRVEEIWFTRCSVPTASGLAIRHGWFEDEFRPDGIAVRSIRGASDKNVRESHFTHSLANSFRQGGSIPALYARSQGQDISLIGLQALQSYRSIIALPGSGIRKLDDLRGRRIGVANWALNKIDYWRASTLESVDGLLAEGGLRRTDVELVDVPVATSYVGDPDHSKNTPRLNRLHTPELLALLRGEVDAIVAHGANGIALREQFSAAEVIGRHFSEPLTLVVSTPLLRSRPDIVVRYVERIVRAARWGNANPEEAKRIFAAEMGTAEYWYDEAAESRSQSLDLSLEENLVADLKRRQTFLLENGFIPFDIDIDAWIDREPLQQALARAG